MIRHHQGTMTFSRIPRVARILILFVLADCRCGKSPTTPDPESAVPSAGSNSGSAVGFGDAPVCEEPKPPACDRVACGANSPAVNTFPVNGLRTDGECNYDGTQLLPHSLAGGALSCNNTTLAVLDNQLVGLGADGNVAGSADNQCKGAALKGATFVLRSWVLKDGKPKTMRVHVADVIPMYPSPHGRMPREAYRLTDDKGNSLCTVNGSTKARDQLGLAQLEGLSDPGAGKDVVIPVRTELYDRNANAFPIDRAWKLHVPEWLHLACVDDSLAKRSLYDLDTDNVPTSRAALMMLIANYCGNLHATTRGAEIEWVFADDATATATVHARLLEAKWGEHGAYCVSNPRALYQQGAKAVPRDPQGDLKTLADHCPGCTADAWTAKVRACDALKSLAKPPDARPSCEECKHTECQGVVLRSYVVPVEPGRP